MICAIFSFWSHTYDAIDGLQARRTSSTSPVGELFDHSLDSYKVLPFVLTLFAPFANSESRVTPIRSLIILFEILLSYSLAFWGQYFTKILYITWSFEMCYITFILHIIAYFDGANLATAYVFGQWKVCNLIQLIFHVCCIFSVLCSLHHIYQFYISRPATERQNLIYSTKSLIPFAELYITAILWAIFSPGKVLQRDLLVFLFIISTTNTNLIMIRTFYFLKICKSLSVECYCRLIISHMSGTRADVCNILTLLYSAVALLSISNVLLPNEELLLMRFLAILLFIANTHYFYCVVQQMCSKLKIEVFSLSYKSDPRKQG